MNVLDGGALASMVFGFLRGRKRGLGKEVVSLVNTGVPLLAGCGLFKLVGKAVDGVPGVEAEKMGAFSFGAVVVAIYLFLKKGLRKLALIIEARYAASNRPNRAGIVGLSRYALAALGVITGMTLLPGDWLTGNSWLAGLLQPFLGG